MTGFSRNMVCGAEAALQNKNGEGRGSGFLYAGFY
jgi:hypothetical protein